LPSATGSPQFTRGSHPLPEDISDEQAAWGPLAFITQTGVRHAEHVLGDTAVVIGLGPLGQLAVQYLRLMGLWEILAIDTDQWRLDVALQHGATHGFLGDAGDAKQFVAEHTEGHLDRALLGAAEGAAAGA